MILFALALVGERDVGDGWIVGGGFDRGDVRVNGG